MSLFVAVILDNLEFDEEVKKIKQGQDETCKELEKKRIDAFNRMEKIVSDP